MAKAKQTIEIFTTIKAVRGRLPIPGSVIPIPMRDEPVCFHSHSQLLCIFISHARRTCVFSFPFSTPVCFYSHSQLCPAHVNRFSFPTVSRDRVRPNFYPKKLAAWVKARSQPRLHML
jgi:hypothetical protein